MNVCCSGFGCLVVLRFLMVCMLCVLIVVIGIRYEKVGLLLMIMV